MSCIHRFSKGWVLALAVLLSTGSLGEAAPSRLREKKSLWGKFVSFKDAMLTIKLNSGDLVENRLPEDTKTLVWNDGEGLYKPEPTADVLKETKPGTWCVVRIAEQEVTLRLGAKKSSVVGTFVSFKNERMLLLGRNLGESFVKKYGNNMHFNRLSDDVQVYESIDGGEYKLVGPANKVLGDVKEGAVVTVHGQGDDNITLIQIGVPKQK